MYITILYYSNNVHDSGNLFIISLMKNDTIQKMNVAIIPHIICQYFVPNSITKKSWTCGETSMKLDNTADIAINDIFSKKDIRFFLDIFPLCDVLIFIINNKISGVFFVIYTIPYARIICPDLSLITS